MAIEIGVFYAGFGDLYRIADIWKGDEHNWPEIQIENISGDHWAFQWISLTDFTKHFEEVGLDV